MQSKQHLDQSYESFVSKSCSKDCWKPPSRAISEYCPLERAIYIYCPAIPLDPPMQSGIFHCKGLLGCKLLTRWNAPHY